MLKNPKQKEGIKSRRDAGEHEIKKEGIESRHDAREPESKQIGLNMGAMPDDPK